MRIPILTYHKLVKHTKDKMKDSYTLSEDDFLAHMEFLSLNGYKPILVDDYYRACNDPSVKLPQKSVLVTFDDGHESNLTMAVPILRRFNFKASFFITTGPIGTPNFMNPFQLRELKEAGMSVQSHAKTHLFLSELNINDLSNELVESKKVLEDILGTEVAFISFPGGRYNSKTLEYAQKAKYLSCFTSNPFYFKRIGDFFVIGRCTMRYISDKTPFEETLNLSDFGKSLRMAAYYGKDLLKKVLGNDIYYFLWKIYVSR